MSTPVMLHVCICLYLFMCIYIKQYMALWIVIFNSIINIWIYKRIHLEIEIDTKIDRNIMFLVFKNISQKKKDWKCFPNLLFGKLFLLLSQVLHKHTTGQHKYLWLIFCQASKTKHVIVDLVELQMLARETDSF